LPVSLRRGLEKEDDDDNSVRLQRQGRLRHRRGNGIGRAAALGFAKAGASAAVVGRSEASLKETVRLIEDAGGRAIAIQADVANEAEVEAAVARTVETFGRPFDKLQSFFEQHLVA
jgi:NAD(P)-dependent dehydrogenase (short-subunit alcohol dehydrogenase family)